MSYDNTILIDDRAGIDESLQTLLAPRAVAVIGATEDFRTFAGAPVHNLVGHGYSGSVYPVNPQRAQVQGLDAFPSVLDIPGPVDSVVIAVPSAVVLKVLAQAIEKGVKSAIIVSSGFGEEAAGPEGKARHAELEALIRSSHIRILGPNTTGIANLADGYVPRAAFNQFDADKVRTGPVALVTQSGACGNIVFNRAQAHGVGIGLSIATGDQIDIDIWEMAELAIHDPRFVTVLVVAETLGDIARMEKVALRAAEAQKIVGVLKLGRSEVGRQAVMTHSGSLAGDSAVESAAMRQLGLVEVDDLDDLWRLAQLVQAWGLPEVTEGRLGVMSLSGGEAALIADRCAEHGLALPPCTSEFAQFIKANFEYAMASNPFDPSGEITGRPEKLRLAVRGFLEQNNFTDVLFASPVLRDEQAERQLKEIGAFLEDPRPNVCFSYWPAGDLTRAQERILTETGAPVFAGSGSAVTAIANYRRAGTRRRNVMVNRAIRASRSSVSSEARYFEVRTVLSDAGIAFPPARLARSLSEAKAAAKEIGYPVIVKANVVSTVHKSANGLVALGIAGSSELARAYGVVADASRGFGADGVVVEGHAKGDLEVIVGATRDPGFGPTVLFGSGGTAVEFFRDAGIGIARYMDHDEIRRVILSTRVGAFLADRSPGSVDAAESILSLASDWFVANPQLNALDLNPLLVDLAAGRLVCVDARVA